MRRISTKPARIALLIGVAALVLILDQLAKAWVSANMVSHDTRVIIEGFLRLRYTENSGAAFGLMQGWTGALSVAAIAIIAVIVLSASRAVANNLALTLSLGLVLGGALGNLLDRIRLGFVVDFIEVYGPHIQWGNTVYTFPVFNVADSAITVGVVLIMAILLFGKDPAPTKEPEEKPTYAGVGSTQE